MNTEQKPAAEKVLEDLKGDITSPEDQKILDEWNTEYKRERQGALEMLGKSTVPELKMLPDGQVVTADEHKQATENGQPSGPYDGDGRRA